MAKFWSILGGINNFFETPLFPLRHVFFLCSQSFTGKNHILREFVSILFSKSQFTFDLLAKDVLAFGLQKRDENQKVCFKYFSERKENVFLQFHTGKQRFALFSQLPAA